MLETRYKNDDLIEIGIDEAGRGSFWGPIMAGAVVIPLESTWSSEQRELCIQLRDSKKISPKKREHLAERIQSLLPHCAVGIVSSQEINENGITWANIEAFRRAIHDINIDDTQKMKYRLLIDGVLKIGDLQEIQQELIVEGDDKYMAIAAASILAKVSHDKWIREYCKTNTECDTQYDLVNSKGYGTKRHREGIQIYGEHALHRKVYIKKWVTNSNIDVCLIRF